MDKYNWGIDIHDAFLVSPEAAADVRAWYAEELQGIFNRRQAILTNYFTSIGITGEAQAAWSRLKDLVTPLDSLTVNPLALK